MPSPSKLAIETVPSLQCVKCKQHFFKGGSHSLCQTRWQRLLQIQVVSEYNTWLPQFWNPLPSCDIVRAPFLRVVTK
jgi:hypothetical protein